jgi:hypothetical protein
MAAFDGRSFQWRPLFSKATAFASEAIWVSLKGSHLFSTVATLPQSWPFLMAAFVNGGRF